MNKAYLLLGSNLSVPEQQLRKARKSISEEIGNIEKQSSIYTTAAWGKTDQPDFLNQVLIVKTKLSAEEILKGILKIEKEQGRIRTEKNAPRIIDIDILFFNNEIIRASHLSIPHPSLQDRRFVLVPLNELSPTLVHPSSHKTMKELLSECTDKLDVKRF